MYEGIRCCQLDTGTTVFLPLKPAAMKEMRRAVRNAVSSGDEPQPFVVRACVEYYGGRIEQVISQPSLIEYVQSCTGSTGNAITVCCYGICTKKTDCFFMKRTVHTVTPGFRLYQENRQ